MATGCKRLLCALVLWLAAGAPLDAQVLNLPEPMIVPPGGAPLEIAPLEIEPLDVAPLASEPIGAGPLVPTPDFDPYLYDQQPQSWPLSDEYPRLDGYGRGWSWQFLPDGLVYRSYLAGIKESRMSSNWAYERNLGWIWDVTLGGRVGLFRYGSRNSFRPEGWQLDIEGAAMPRLDMESDEDLISSDFRFGVPLTYAMGVFETKLAYYHLSAHLGDEFMLKNPAIVRLNYSRDVIVLGLATYWTEDLRLYAEAGYAVLYDGGAEPWEFQFGLDYSPVGPSSYYGAPFFAVNTYLREEADYGGTFTAQAGWQWRGHGSRHLFRLGAQYLTGRSPQLEFVSNERQLGFALWYDY